MTGLNNFGNLSTDYDQARRGYTNEVFEYVKSLIKKPSPKTLDIGCGTGISTRELKENGFEVIGADKDSAMVEVAKKRSPEISYLVAMANELPFESEQFDIVTAFTAFHWFNNEESLTEIKRVLRNGGVFFAALKISDENDNGYWPIYEKYAGDNFDSTDNHFKKEFLIKSGFSDIEEKVFYVDEKYTVDGLLTLTKSLSFWNLVSENKKPEMLKELKDFYEKRLVDGLFTMHRKISTVATFKK
jgi:ubiquinone/menaquinone biosynthesis C-methylase UbiE